MEGKLASDEKLKSYLDAIRADDARERANQTWYQGLAEFILNLRAEIPHGALRKQDFLRQLWDENPVAATGMGFVKVAPALQNADFTEWFESAVTAPLDATQALAEAQLIEIYDALCEKMGSLCQRTPRLKINRVLCALFPEFFTTVADPGKILYLHKEMGGKSRDHVIHAHIAVRNRLDSVLGAVTPGDIEQLVRRICMPWMLYERVAGDSVEPQAALSVSVGLKPLPAVMRRKGLTSVKGGFPTLLGCLPELDEGITKDEFAEIFRRNNPNLAPQSIATSINVVAREFDLCRLEGGTYRLSSRGINLLATQDPDELADHLLTKTLGIDALLKELTVAPKTKSDLTRFLQSLNPGWTTDYAPVAQIGWLVSLGAIELNKQRQYQLTERGRLWAEMVTWEPEGLPTPLDKDDDSSSAPPAATSIPGFGLIWNRLTEIKTSGLNFDKWLVEQIHAGLWFHPVRHFVVLTGISGSGKTQLAHNYSLALCDVPEEGPDRVSIIPVQPGWYDPSPLLGYVNPLQDASYRVAPFLELLLRAASDPERPYIAILDEMNLSHPEQYLAPVLSAMETHGWLDLHLMEEGSSTVPQRVKYPSNLAIIGTLNMDETTHGLSDKVLDRAYTLEFWDINVADFPGWRTVNLPSELLNETKLVLEQLGKVLSPARLHFGWRTISDVLNFLEFHSGIAATGTDALDSVIYAKVLPKLRGESSVKFERALHEALAVLSAHGLKRCRQKVESMQADLLATGSARFWR